MCQTNTIGDIARQKEDKLRISLENRFLNPSGVLQRYHDFYANAQALIKSSSDSEITITKDLFKEREEQFKNALQKNNTSFSYDTETKILDIRLGDKKYKQSKYKQSVDQGAYLLDVGEDGSVIGIKIFNVIL